MKAKVIATGETIYDVEEYLFDVGRFQVHGRTKEGKSVFFRAEEVTLLPKEFQEKDIDWEQRRYEIAKDLYCHYEHYDASQCVRYADDLIEVIKLFNKQKKQ